MTDDNWFGTPPEDWEVRPLGYYFRERKEVVSDRDFPPLSVTMAGIVPQLETAAKTDNNDNRKLVRAGDFVINSRSDRKGSSGLSGQDGSVSMISTVLVPRAIEGRFAHHLLRSPLFQEEFYRWGSGIVADLWSTRYAAMKRIPLAVPPAPEQRAIADFLDRETVQIDAMVDAQERLVALLEERRTALIDALVGRGLNDPPLSDSGVPWLPEVPAHWTRMPLRYAISYQEGPGIGADDFLDEGVPLIRVSGVRGRFATLEGANYLDPGKVSSRWNHFRIQLHDLLISASASMGTVSEAGPEVVGAVPYTGIIRVTPRQGVSRDFMRWFLVSSAFTKQIDLLKTGSTIQHYGPTHLDRMFIHLAPIEEQRQIARRLDQATASMDEMITKARQSVALMKERRAALISAAVTGRIDVRTGIEQVERDLEEARV